MKTNKLDFLISAGIFGFAGVAVVLGYWPLAVIAIAAWVVVFGMRR